MGKPDSSIAVKTVGKVKMNKEITKMAEIVSQKMGNLSRNLFSYQANVRLTAQLENKLKKFRENA